MWPVEKVISSIYHLFKHAPARREDYLNVCGEDAKFGLKFVGHRWLENGPCVTRTLEIWDNIKCFVQAVQEKKINNPKIASFDAIEAGVKDVLMVAKLKFFSVN
jgi:hypothetical protein